MKNDHNVQFQYILFDLDNTLYPKEAGLMDAIVKRIALFMTQRIGIPADDVMLKRHSYLQQYGTTLRGLMEEYDVNPEEYLAFVHDLNPGEFLGPSPPLARMLEAIPLRKVIFTNANISHCNRVLNSLQVQAHFERVIDIEAVGYKNKPNPLAYERALTLLGVSGECCIMVEDAPRNLMAAKDLGMTTILVDGDHKVGDTSPTGLHIDYAVPTIFHVERVLAGLLPAGRS